MLLPSRRDLCRDGCSLIGRLNVSVAASSGAERPEVRLMVRSRIGTIQISA